MTVNSLLRTPTLWFLASAISVATLPTVLKSEDGPLGTKSLQYRPSGFKQKLARYNLAREFQINQRRAAARQSYNYSTFLVKEFQDHYYPKAKFDWYRAGNKSRNIGIRKFDQNKIQEVYLSWTSFADGLLWGFLNIEIARTTNVDPFAIICGIKVTKAIKKDLLARQLIDSPQHVTDVFSIRVRSFQTEQKTSDLTFPASEFGKTQYGVTIRNKVYFFTAQGEATKLALR